MVMKKFMKMFLLVGIVVPVVFLVGCIDFRNTHRCNCPKEDTSMPHVFQTVRELRQQNRLAIISALENIITSPHITEQERNIATEHLFKLFASIGFETASEALIMAHMRFKEYGFIDVVVQRFGDNINVLVKYHTNLTHEQAEKIHYLLERLEDDYIDKNNLVIAVVRPNQSFV